MRPELEIDPSAAGLASPSSGMSASAEALPLAARLLQLQSWIGDDLLRIETDLATVASRGSLEQQSARYLLDLGGKRLRPICVVLAAGLGPEDSADAHELAVAVELIHAATLLHDDVIDFGDQRRGAPTARRIYGNAASVLAGDWLLIEALGRVRRLGWEEILDRAMAAIRTMIEAEAVQLGLRGELNDDRETYFRIVDGKTAALFRLALWGGGRLGGLGLDQCGALERYGAHLGMTFQLIDDLLDFNGDPARTGKALFADLREGKMTYPLLVALGRDQELRPVVERVVDQCDLALEGEQDPTPTAAGLAAQVRQSIVATGAADDCLALARRHARDAVAALDSIPRAPGRDALVTVAEACVRRQA